MKGSIQAHVGPGMVRCWFDEVFPEEVVFEPLRDVWEDCFEDSYLAWWFFKMLRWTFWWRRWMVDRPKTKEMVILCVFSSCEKALRGLAILC